MDETIQNWKFEKHMEEQYQEWYALLEYERCRHKQELEQLKEYLCDKVDEYLQEKGAEFYAALVTLDEQKLEQLRKEIKAQVTG